MKNEKVDFLVKMIKDLDIKDKLRLAICMCNSNWLHLEYDKVKYLDHFDKLLKENDEEYRTALIDFCEYKLIMFAMAKIMEMEQTERNEVALYLFNRINCVT